MLLLACVAIGDVGHHVTTTSISGCLLTVPYVRGVAHLTPRRVPRGPGRYIYLPHPHPHHPTKPPQPSTCIPQTTQLNQIKCYACQMVLEIARMANPSSFVFNHVTSRRPEVTSPRESTRCVTKHVSAISARAINMADVLSVGI